MNIWYIEHHAGSSVSSGRCGKMHSSGIGDQQHIHDPQINSVLVKRGWANCITACLCGQSLDVLLL